MASIPDNRPRHNNKPRPTEADTVRFKRRLVEEKLQPILTVQHTLMHEIYRLCMVDHTGLTDKELLYLKKRYETVAKAVQEMSLLRERLWRSNHLK